MIKTATYNRHILIGCTVFVAILAMSLALQMATPFGSAYGLTRYFNCVTKIANSHGDLGLDDITRCYDKVFQGANGYDEYGHRIR